MHYYSEYTYSYNLLNCLNSLLVGMKNVKPPSGMGWVGCFGCVGGKRTFPSFVVWCQCSVALPNLQAALKTFICTSVTDICFFNAYKI